MIKIAIIASHAPSLVNFRGPFIKLLSDRGFCVLALAPNYSERTRAEVSKLGGIPVDFKMNRAGLNPVRDALDALRLTFLLRKLKPDVSLSYFVKPVIFGTLAAWIARVPRRIAMIEGLGFVFTPTPGLLSLRRKSLRHLVRTLYRFALSRAHRVVFLNPDDMNEFISKNVLSFEKSFLLGGIGVDLEEWRAAPPYVRPVTFLLVARMLREKGVIEYAEAARLVKRKHPEARFILLGGLDDSPGSLTDNDLLSWVDEGILEWKGHQPVRPWLKEASVFVLPSYYREGVPRSTQEAMAMGRAVITTNAPGCRETVVDGINGFLIPIYDVQNLAEKMTVFIENPDRIISMGQASRRLAEERFNVHEANRRLASVLLGQSESTV